MSGLTKTVIQQEQRLVLSCKFGHNKPNMAAPCNHIFAVLLIHALVIISSGSKWDDEFEGLRTLTVEHSFESGPNPVFTKRGIIVIRSLKGNRAHFQELSPFDLSDKHTLQRASEDDGVYRVRIPIATGDSEEDTHVSTFVMACSIYESRLSDQLIINVDQSGEVLGVSMTTFPSECIGREIMDSDIVHWNTTVDIIQTVHGPTPDTQSYIEKLKHEESERAKGQQGESKSFLGKYWMYIVPFVIVVMLMSNADQGQGGGR